MPVTRFAPSPNGPLHLGHAYAAIVAHDLARAGAGAFRLRIEDIDAGRRRPALIAAIHADLAWLGLAWDGAVTVQSQCLPRYHAAVEHLRALGLLYPCTCTRAEIAAASTAIGPDGPLYPGTCRGRDVAAGGDVCWRLDMVRAVEGAGGALFWEDALAGHQRASPAIFGDVVLVRKTAAGANEPSYHLAATLDDAADGITAVTRGQDLFAASHLHRLLQALLGLTVPRWHHHPLVVEADGRKLSKRRGSPGLADLRCAGVDGRALAEDLRRGILPAGLSLGPGVGWRA